jgi:uncharacterized membrane protein
MARLIFILTVVMLLNSSKAASQLHFNTVGDSGRKDVNLRVLPQNFYNQHMGYFCKKEVQIQKALVLPIYFRLGSKEYTDWMEKKPSSLKKQ